MQNDSRLKIHTNAQPVEAEPTAAAKIDPTEGKPKEQAGYEQKRKKARVRPTRRKERSRETKEGMTVGEKLLRNTAVACALLLTVMSLKNIDRPWSRKMTEGVRQAMTMRIDWDETLGRLSFVKALVPETALVFFNLGQNADLEAPAEGELIHEYTEQQPWLEFKCAPEQQVVAAMDGIVTAVGQGAGQEWIVLIQNADGAEAVYGYLENVYVKSGQEVKAGQQIGATAQTADSRLYFELREGGEPTDPTERMKP